MSEEQKAAIILVNALLCIKFKLNPVKWQIVYHHWHDTTGTKFTEEQINSGVTIGKQKTCPGSSFFNGNKIIDAENLLLPFVKSKIDTLKEQLSIETAP
ncbi:MAG: hypothetical protein IPM34_06955 [Saprospiraceae bacterium]|nr:hypothetical protein [Saprospiraceae bacterium]